MTYNRFLIPLLAPKNIAKAIYLDADIILLGDIKKYYEQDLKGKIFGTISNTCAHSIQDLKQKNSSTDFK